MPIVPQECLKNSSAEDRQAILASFLASFAADASGDTICTVLRDSYGNYVAQKLLDVSPAACCCGAGSSVRPDASAVCMPPGCF